MSTAFNEPQPLHQPVMVSRVLEGLAVRPGGAYIDCTLGDAGHATAILDAAAPGGRLLGIDADPEAIDVARHRLARYGAAATVVHANFATLERLATAHGFMSAAGVLFDLGLSSRQLDAEDRGFSFQREAPLDMRFDPTGGAPASELVNATDERELTDLISRLGEEPRSRRIARAIVQARPITSALQLGEVVRRASGYRRGRTHPATRTFQALRMAVNRELVNLEQALGQVAQVLDQGGRLVTIAYHSLEDRLIKVFLAGSSQDESGQTLRRIARRVVRPDTDEVQRNRRARSARMRVAEKA